MKNQEDTITAPAEKELFIKMAVSAWDTYNTRLTKLFDKLTDEQLSSQIAPNKNSGVYLLGHMVAISDAMQPLLGFGEKLYPELWKIFVDSPDRSGQSMPTIEELKKYWEDVNAHLTRRISNMKPDEWFTKHAAVSEEDFAKEPHRNKLNLLMNRTNHVSYHLGQLTLLQ
jgi:hypothetical protein